MKVLVIGLDGVPLNLINRWMEAGSLPTLKGLIDAGTVAPLNSTIPHTSAPAWTSFMTGKSPGKTGVYDFLYRKEGTYTFYPHDVRSRTGQSLWQILSNAGKSVGVLNVPMTYPVETLRGDIISGFMTPYYAKDYTSPRSLLEDIRSEVKDYHIYPAVTFSEKNPKIFFDASKELLKMRTQAALFMMERRDWDFMMTVFFDTDRILHQTWHYLEPIASDPDPDTDNAKLIQDYFKHLDASIKQLIEKAGDDTLVFVMSDHGMGRSENMIVLNTWLLEKGYLHLKKNPIALIKTLLFRVGATLRNVHRFVDWLGLAKQAEYRALYSADRLLKKLFLSFNDVDWSKSKAYSYGRSNGPIFINLKGREPEGIVEPGEEYDALCAEIKALAKEMVDPRTGRKLVGEVQFSQEVYQGTHFDRAPDLIFTPAVPTDTFYGLSDFGSNELCQPMYRYTGMHRQHGMLIADGDIVATGAELDDAQIVDVAPTILHALGVPIPDDMDGRPLLELFLGEKADADSVKWRPADLPDQDFADSGYTEDEAQEIEERLRQLGYLG